MAEERKFNKEANEITEENAKRSELKKERFEFILSINDSIVCQRYFRMYGYRNESANSIEVVEALDACVNLINNNLKRKTATFFATTAPQIFKNNAECDAYMKNHTLETPSFVVVKEYYNEKTNEVENNALFVTDNDGKLSRYSGQYFNFNDYINNIDECNDRFTLSLLEYGKVVCEKTWDASVFPRFIRSNIDLSNKRNRFKPVDFSTYPFEWYCVEAMNVGLEDLVPSIVNTFVEFLARPEDYKYTTRDVYETVDKDGNVVDSKSYELNLYYANLKNTRKWENKLRKKTEEYMKSLYL